MFKDFNTTKKQLVELADIVNTFKSEAVQLKLLELLFDATPHEDETEASPPEPQKPKKRTRKKASPAKKSTKSDNGANGSKKTSSFGPVSILNKLHEEGFFSKARTIADICQHADTNLARKIKPNEISGKLARMVRNGELSRQKNSDNQYEYTKP